MLFLFTKKFTRMILVLKIHNLQSRYSSFSVFAMFVKFRWFSFEQRLSTANEEIIEVLLSKQQLLPALRYI